MNRKNNSVAILGIHTGIGKTIVSAVLTEALQAHYWKPVQAGIEDRDMITVQSLITDGEARVHPEAVLLRTPASPHTAAAIEGVTIDFQEFSWPITCAPLLVETAGGVLSPMTDTATMADFVTHFQLPVIVVSQNYLGSINHTLTAIETLKNRTIPILGIVMSGDTDTSSESFITNYTNTPIIARIPHIAPVSAEHVQQIAAGLDLQWLLSAVR